MRNGEALFKITTFASHYHLRNWGISRIYSERECGNRLLSACSLCRRHSCSLLSHTCPPEKCWKYASYKTSRDFTTYGEGTTLTQISSDLFLLWPVFLSETLCCFSGAQAFGEKSFFLCCALTRGISPSQKSKTFYKCTGGEFSRPLSSAQRQ